MSTRVLFMDGRDANGIPWEKGTPNEPVFVQRFKEYDDMPFVFSDSGKVFRMLPSKDSSFGYRLEEDKTSRGTDALLKGYTVTEEEAVSLLS